MLEWPITMKREINHRFKGRKSPDRDHSVKADRTGSQWQRKLITGGKILRNQLWKVQWERAKKYSIVWYQLGAGTVIS